MVTVNVMCPALVTKRWFKEGVGQQRYKALNAANERSTPLRRACKPMTRRWSGCRSRRTPPRDGGRLFRQGGAPFVAAKVSSGSLLESRLDLADLPFVLASTKVRIVSAARKDLLPSRRRPGH